MKLSIRFTILTAIPTNIGVLVSPAALRTVPKIIIAHLASIGHPLLGDTKYATLEDAFAAAIAAGKDIELIAPEYETIVVPAEFTGKLVINGNVVVENANGSAITGENINISMKVKNIGLKPTSNITLKLTTDSKYVTISKDNAQLNAINSAEVIELQNVFSINVKPNVPNETKVNFVLTCSDGKDTWESTFHTYAYAPVFSVISVATTSNKIINPGETGTLEMKFENVGGADANNILTEMFSSSSDIKFENMSATTEELAAGESTTFTADFTVASSAQIGSVYDIVCTANADYATCTSLYVLKVGMMGDNFESGDFSANDWKIEGKGYFKIQWC